MIEALGNHVVIKQIEEDEKMYGNILIPDMGKEKPMVGTVLSVGPGGYSATGTLIPTSVEVGEKVFFPIFGATKVMWEGEEYVICKDIDLLAKIK